MAPEKTKWNIGWAWVVGVYASPSKVRFAVVDDRKSDALIPIISTFVEEGGTVVTDEWAGYKRLQENGFVHRTVCHKRNFVNPETGFHTNDTERRWQEGRAYCRRTRGAGRYFQSHLDEISYRILTKDTPEGLLAAFFRDVAKYYPSSLDGEALTTEKSTRVRK